MSYEVKEVPLSKVFSDDVFNCRGKIYPMDVVDLVKDIETHGLQFPIAVQPACDIKKNIGDHEYRIVAGHRRYAAFSVMQKETIPVMIKRGLSEAEARLLNLGENLKRENLNLLQEARAIERLKLLGMVRRDVAEALGVSASWVQVRYNLLDLPEAIQDEAASGLLNQSQIKQIYGLRTPERQYEAVKKIKNARLRGEQGISVAKEPKLDPFKKKRQPKNVVQDMIQHMSNVLGYGLHTRALAWANGEINSAELYFDIKRVATERGIDYRIPIGLNNDIS